MALTMTNVGSVDLSPHPLRITFGTFTCTAGADSNTQTITGGRVFGYGFETNDTGGDVDRATMVYSATTGLITCTVENETAVTDGTYWFLHQ